MVIIVIVTATTPSNPNAITMAITTLDVFDRPSCDEPAILLSQRKILLLSLATIRLVNPTISICYAK
jgi:hypothetical protein